MVVVLYADGLTRSHGGSGHNTASGLWISGPALPKQSSSSCFWYTDGLQPVKDLLLSTEGGLKISLKFLQGKVNALEQTPPPRRDPAPLPLDTWVQRGV